MSKMSKDGVRSKGGSENSRSRTTRNTNIEVQRAIEGLKDIPDDELQEFLDDEEFMQDLDVVDAWDGEDDTIEDYSSSHNREREGKRISREPNRRERRGTFQNLRDQRDRVKREERRRDDIRRDPSKSSKDIERDKIRTKKDTDSKALAEKEKAIKHLLDSGAVVPPGTEVEAIETEKQNLDSVQDRSRKSRERRRSLDRHRISPGHRRSVDRINRLILSPHRESHNFVGTPDRRRSMDRTRKNNWDRRSSLERRARSRERRASIERHRRRMEERDQRISRRSRSRDRHRSRSQDRFRRRWSRSPNGRRGSPRRRSVSKSPDRRRKRSPFLNELARQLRDVEALRTSVNNPPNQGYIQQQQQRAPPPLMSTPMHMQVPQQHYMSHPEPLGPPAMPGPTGFIAYDAHAPQPASINFEPMPMHAVPQPDYSTVMFNPPVHPQVRSDFVSLSVASPQPVPAPNIDQGIMFNRSCAPQMESPPNLSDRSRDSGHRGYSEHRSSSGYNNEQQKSRRERLSTPEPPVISNTKTFEKTSLSSLLEASVSAKDSGLPVLYPGFKPEILRHCELALRDLPDEDPRLKIKGRFFFDPKGDESKNGLTEHKSNSILLRRNKCKQIWNSEKHSEVLKPLIIMRHQKSCQTDLEVEDREVQTEVTMVDFCVQVCPGDLQPPREEKRPIMDRLDWNVREPYDYPAREADDLRWSLSNSSQKRSWNRALSSDPEHRRSPDHRPVHDYDSREFIHRGSPIRSRDNFSTHSNNYSPRERYSPYRRSEDHQDDYHEIRSDRSRDDSPLIIDEHEEMEEEEVEIIEHETFSRESGWRGRGKSYGHGSSHKTRPSRGKSYSGGRGSYRGRGTGGYRGKF